MDPWYSSPRFFTDIRLVNIRVISKKQTKNKEKNSNKVLWRKFKLICIWSEVLSEFYSFIFDVDLFSDFFILLTYLGFKSFIDFKMFKINIQIKITTKLTVLVIISSYELDNERPFGIM